VGCEEVNSITIVLRPVSLKILLILCAILTGDLSPDGVAIIGNLALSFMWNAGGLVLVALIRMMLVSISISYGLIASSYPES
jgi:hypothetical protein